MRYFLLLFLIFTSCRKVDNSGFEIFKIKKGNHKSTYRLEYTNKSIFNFSIILSDGCKYKNELPVNQYDVNKIIGISDGASHIKNSARFGWRYVNSKLELMAYTHYDGDFQFEKICDIEEGVTYDCQLILGSEYTFRVNDIEVYMPRYKNIKAKNYYLYPYFGGDEVAPSDIILKIKY